MTPREYGAFVEGKPLPPQPRIMTAIIPACDQHEGIYSMTVRILGVCPVCGGARGILDTAMSYDGSRRLFVNTWVNPCGHIDSYAAVRAEAKANGLNGVS